MAERNSYRVEVRNGEGQFLIQRCFEQEAAAWAFVEQHVFKGLMASLEVLDAAQAQRANLGRQGPYCAAQGLAA
jgi:hypothetical protein